MVPTIHSEKKHSETCLQRNRQEHKFFSVSGRVHFIQVLNVSVIAIPGPRDWKSVLLKRGFRYKQVQTKTGFATVPN